MATVTKVISIWKMTVCMKSKIQSLCAKVFWIYLRGSWTLTAELQSRTEALKIWCYRTIRITNVVGLDAISQRIAPLKDHINMIKKLEGVWPHVIRANNLPPVILQGNRRKRNRLRREWADDVTEWTARSVAGTLTLECNRDIWRELI